MSQINSSSVGRAWWRGALSWPALAVMVVAGTAAHWPNWLFLGPFARMLESVAPQLLGLGVVFALVLWALGARGVAGMLVLGLCAGAGLQGVQHWRLSTAVQAAPQSAAPLRILWFNMLKDNPTDPDRLVAALDQSGADLVILTEATPVVAQRAALEAHFSQVLGCNQRLCNLMVLARDPDLKIRLRRLDALRRDRMAVIEAQVEGRAVTIVATHLVKPWFYGFTEADDWHVIHQLSQISGPVLIVGDFNAAPWSARMRNLMRRCKILPPRRPVATWPASAGGLGVPIDLALTRDGAVLEKLEPWGAGLGSNHRGLLIELGVAARAPSERPRCRVPVENYERLGLTR